MVPGVVTVAIRQQHIHRLINGAGVFHCCDHVVRVSGNIVIGQVLVHTDGYQGWGGPASRRFASAILLAFWVGFAMGSDQ